MFCYHVLVHGRLSWPSTDKAASDPFRSDSFFVIEQNALAAERPRGFYYDRHVFALSARQAEQSAFRSARAELDRSTHWLRDGLATVECEAEDASPAPFLKGLRGGNRGLTFYPAG